MNYSFFTLKDTQLKFSHSLVLLLFACCVIVLPNKGWAQALSDTGSFTFTGSHNPLLRPIFREWLPGDGVKAGPVQVHPFLGIAEAYTDNAFRTNKQRRSDFVTTIAPGFQAFLPFGSKNSFLLDYRAAQFLYKKFSENNVFSQHGTGHAKFIFPNGLKIDLQGDHIEGFDSRGSTLDTQNRDITRWRYTSFLGRTRWDGPRGGIRLSTRFARRHYKNNGQAPIRDRRSARVGVTGSLKATPTTSGLLGVSISNNTFDDNKQLDNFAYGVFTGFALAPSRLLSGEMTVGYTILNFDRAPVGEDPNVADDPADPTMNDPGDRLRAQGLSLGGKQQKILSLRGRLTWTPTTQRTLRITPIRSIQQSATFDTSTFIRTGVTINLDQRFTSRFSLNGSFFYAKNKFEEGRSDNQFRWSTGLEYRMVKWLGLRLAYSFEKRSSNQSNFDYHSNSILVSIQGLL